MQPPVRTAIAAALVLGLTGAATAPALADAHSHAPATTAPAQDSAPDGKALRKAIKGLPNADATAALVRVGGPEGTWRGRSGVHDLVTGRKADPHGRFRAGSTTKIVTAAVALQLAAEGELDLDRPVQHYMPELFPTQKQQRKFEPIPVRSLLNYTSGLKSGDGFDDEYAHRYDTLEPQKVVASAISKGPEHDPGAEQHYRNIGYTVLGLLIERVTGDSYADQASERIFRPLHLHDTYFPGADPRIRGPHNRGYQSMKQPDGTTRLVDVTEWNQSDRFAAGDMISSTADMEVFTQALFGGEVVPRPQLKEMFTLPKLAPGVPEATFGAGLQRMELDDDKVVWLKTGSRYGYSNMIASTENGSRTLVYSVNATDAKGPAMNPVAERIALAALSQG
ncbi:serine hydrolase domain-containing protein [Streptomyces durmitorensis]|uniref:Beta-lactamase family protein n=1 Tax=Streptomyces durmitorensis TaxID=319947 RepID=A0ABY4PQT9_9ACTN|nr:serine hydrolase domain-containing protein [Streptomyces durmitorensis]UQT55961.1 beta-lactamase family protein [Streptomyces durmitorensis]